MAPTGPRSSGPQVLDRAPSSVLGAACIPRPRDPQVLDALLQHARADQRARPRAARVLADVIDRLLDERLAATRSGALAR